MIYVSHRGNLTGPNPKEENKPKYIQQALDSGYHVEIDVWTKQTSFVKNGLIYLGHDKPERKAKLEFLDKDRLICHAKDFRTLLNLLNQDLYHCFYNDLEPFVVTSIGLIWLCTPYPTNNKTLDYSNTILMSKDLGKEWYGLPMSHYRKFKGICSDYIQLVRETLNGSSKRS